MNVETQLKLNKFEPRSYQKPIIEAFKKGFKKLIIVMPRRSGKDIVCFNILIRAALKRIGTYYYILPNAVQARRVMFEGITIDGKRIINFIPDELIKNINIQQMRITLINDSQIHFVGSMDIDSLRGTNPLGIVFSEYAYCHPNLYPTLRPVLLGNDGFCFFISTPFGENHFYTLYQIAKDSPDWFTYFLTVSDTQHINEEQIQLEIDRGEISPDMAQQEYYCDFSTGAIGAYYAKYLINMENNNQISDVAWEPNFPVHSAWDLGMRDSTAILMFQNIANTTRIIDMYVNSSVGMEHYINVLQSKPYTWGKHIAPHDIRVREFTSGGLSRYEKAANLGIRFIIAPDMSVIDGIESVRTTLPRMYIDQTKCKPLIAALRNYRKEYDSMKKVYHNHPLHDENSHIADALRYLCTTLPKTKDSSNPEQLERRYQEVAYGGDQLKGFFRDTIEY